MKDYAITIHRDSKTRFRYTGSEIISSVHMCVTFEGDISSLKPNDLLLSQYDKDNKLFHNVIYVKNVLPDGRVTVGRPDDQYIKDLRKFNKDEEFILIASYRPVIEEPKSKNNGDGSPPKSNWRKRKK